MHLLQPQTEVNVSSLVSTLSTSDSDSSLQQVQRLPWANLSSEAEQVDWLILHFNHWFSHLNVTLVRGDFEPEYFPATKIALPGSSLRMASLIVLCMKSVTGLLPVTSAVCCQIWLWYAPDGRTKEQQALFEQVEIKPQAIEWMFSKAFGRRFRVSG